MLRLRLWGYLTSDSGKARDDLTLILSRLQRTWLRKTVAVCCSLFEDKLHTDGSALSGDHIWRDLCNYSMRNIFAEGENVHPDPVWKYSFRNGLIIRGGRALDKLCKERGGAQIRQAMHVFFKRTDVYGVLSFSNCSAQDSLKKLVGILYDVSVRSWRIAEDKMPKLSTLKTSDSLLELFLVQDCSLGAGLIFEEIERRSIKC